MTEKLFYQNEYIKKFDATVLSCVKNDDVYEVVLDKTAFFPEGGGQKADSGLIGGITVIDVQETENGIIHYCEKELLVGEKVKCTIDWELRFRRMQQHSGEHIVSGIVHSVFGYNNIGFHMDDHSVTIDFNGELDRVELNEIENKANSVIYDNLPIYCYFPSENELKNIEYRSKLDLTENVRLVEINGVDLCACCAPHVNRTGEVGLIKILDYMRHRGGVRLVVKSGFDAFDDYRNKCNSVYGISNLLSAKQTEIVTAVERVKNELDESHKELYNFKLSVAENAKKNIKYINDCSLLISENFDTDMLRLIVNFGMEKSRLSLAFSGNDNEGYSYIAGSDFLDMKKIAKEINCSLNGRGGGRDKMIQGKISATQKCIYDFINKIDLGEIENG